MTWFIAVVFASVLLSFITVVDLDGDATTPNGPDVGLTEQAGVRDVAEHEADASSAVDALTRRTRRHAAQFVRRAERWTVVLRRFHRSITDIPI
ncbi:MAG: hypothetical protein ACHQNA_00100 [Acidimicrobiales bacterium]